MPRKLPDLSRREATPEEKDSIVIDLEWLERHVTEDEHGCWVWNGFITKQGQPQARITVKPKVTATMLVRRLVARMTFTPSKKFPDAVAFMRNRQAGVLTTCSRGCCHPDHIRMRTKVQAMAPTKGKPISLTHRMRISAARRKNSNISDADIRRMLLDPRPGKHVAEEFGVHHSYVPHVRTGKLRVYSTMGNNLFSGLLTASNSEFFRPEEQPEKEWDYVDNAPLKGPSPHIIRKRA